MANTQIPNLPAAISLSGSEQVEVVQSGVSRRATTQQIADLKGVGPTGPTGPMGPTGLTGPTGATLIVDGFLYIPTYAGVPTGTPTAITGLAPLVINTTNNKLYFYSGGAWRDAGP